MEPFEPQTGAPSAWRRAADLLAATPREVRGVVVLLFLAVIGCAGLLWVSRPGGAPLVVDATAARTSGATRTPTGTTTQTATSVASGPVPGASRPAPSEPPDDLVVHVSGAVAAPGVVVVPRGSRVTDAVAAAGGMTRRADAAAVNLARPLADGEQVHVPRPDEAVPPAADGGAQAGPLDVNVATVADLEALPGIGPVIAQRIVDWRERHGPFVRVEDLRQVSGIGPATLGGLTDLVRV